jgi:hypothetical protein
VNVFIMTKRDIVTEFAPTALACLVAPPVWRDPIADGGHNVLGNGLQIFG